jgi:hypothetical protein
VREGGRESGILANCDVQLGVFVAVSPDGFLGLGFADDIGGDGVFEGGIG